MARLPLSPLAADIDATGNRIINVGSPTAQTDAVNVQYLDNLLAGIGGDGTPIAEYNAATTYTGGSGVLVTLDNIVYQLTSPSDVTGVPPTDTSAWRVVVNGNASLLPSLPDDHVYVGTADGVETQLFSTHATTFGPWAPSQTYKIGDVVSYEGEHFMAIVAHSSTNINPYELTTNWITLSSDGFQIDTLAALQNLNAGINANINPGDVAQVISDGDNNGFYIILTSDNVNRTAGTTAFKLENDGGAETFAELSGSIGFGQFPAGGTIGQVLKSTGDPGVVEWQEDNQNTIDTSFTDDDINVEDEVPSVGAVVNFVDDKFNRVGTNAVQYFNVAGLPNGGTGHADPGATVEEVLEFSDFNTDDRFIPTFDVDINPIVDTIAFSINNVGDAATAVNNGDWTVAIENRYKAIFTKNGETVVKTLIKGDGSAQVVSSELFCVAYDPMKIPGDNTRSGEKIYIGTENETVLVIDLNEIDFSEGDGSTLVAVAPYGIRGSLTPASEQIDITALGVHYRKVEHLSVTRWIQTVVFGTSVGSLPWISAEVGEGSNFTNFLDLESGRNEGGTGGNIYVSSNEQNNTYETQRGYTLDGGVEFEFAHASVRSIAWDFDVDGGIQMIAVGDSILRPSQSNSSVTERTPLFAIGQLWGIPFGPLTEQYFGTGNDTDANRETLFNGLSFSPLTYLGVDDGLRSGSSDYPSGFKSQFLNNQSDVVLTDFTDLSFIHLKDIIFQQNSDNRGFYVVGDRVTDANGVNGIGLYFGVNEFNVITYQNDNTYKIFDRSLPDERDARVTVINNLTRLGDNDNNPYTKVYLRNDTSSATDKNIVAFGRGRQALEINTTIVSGGTAFGRSSSDQFEDLVNNNDGPFFANRDDFWGGFIPNKDDFTRITVLWGNRNAEQAFNAIRFQQQTVIIKLFDHGAAGSTTLTLTKTNGENIRQFVEKFAAHFGPGQTFPNGSATIIPATKPAGLPAAQDEAVISVNFDPDTTSNDDFTVTVHLGNANLLEPVNAGQTSFSLPIREELVLEADPPLSGTLILGYQLGVPSFDGVPGFNFTVTVGGTDVSSAATLVDGLLELTANPAFNEGDTIVVNYLERSDVIYRFIENTASIINFTDPYTKSYPVHGSIKISLDHLFANEAEVAAFIVSELGTAPFLSETISLSAVGSEIIAEIALNSKGPILHDNDKLSLLAVNPTGTVVNDPPLLITRRFDGDEDEPGSEGGPIDLREVPSRNEMINFIEAAVESIDGGVGITTLSLINATDEFEIDALDAELLTAADPIATQAYVDASGSGTSNVAGIDINGDALDLEESDGTVIGTGVTLATGTANNDALPTQGYVDDRTVSAVVRAIEIDDVSLTSQVDSGTQQTELRFSSVADFDRFLTNAGHPTTAGPQTILNRPAFTFFVNGVSYTVAESTWLYTGGSTFIRWNATNLPQPATDITGGTYHRTLAAANVTTITEGENVNFGLVSGDLVISVDEADLAIPEFTSLPETTGTLGDLIRLTVTDGTFTIGIYVRVFNNSEKDDFRRVGEDIAGIVLPTNNIYDGRVFYLETHIDANNDAGWYVYREARAAVGTVNTIGYDAAITAGWYEAGVTIEATRQYPIIGTGATVDISMAATVHTEPFAVTPGLWQYDLNTYIYSGLEHVVNDTYNQWTNAPVNHLGEVQTGWELWDDFVDDLTTQVGGSDVNNPNFLSDGTDTATVRNVTFAVTNTNEVRGTISLPAGGLTNEDFRDGGYVNAWITGTVASITNGATAGLTGLQIDTITNINGRTETWYEIQGVSWDQGTETLTVSASNSVWTDANPDGTNASDLAGEFTFTV